MSAKTDESGVENYICLNYFRFLGAIAEWEKKVGSMDLVRLSGGLLVKHGFITPFLKKPTLDKEVLSNYRPVTNLLFVSKILERIVSKQLYIHLSIHDILSPAQSAYRPHHSTETALLAFQNDLLQAASHGHGCVVLLLDLNLVFDTIDHEILLD
jgi:hypothetical protein